jgi:tRNA U38,U39,U40 pseudouridine synthase TruA
MKASITSKGNQESQGQHRREKSLALLFALDCRFSAVSKVYHYTLATRPVIDPLSRLYSAHVFYEVRPEAFKTRLDGHTSVPDARANTKKMQQSGEKCRV